MKRLFDIVFSIIGLIICLPIFIGVALLIKIDSSGPIFFKQIRVGKKSKHFTIYKFRTMMANPFKKNLTITTFDDSRITKIGKLLRKTKVDELPQFLNVLKGDMSIVGP